MNFVLVCLIQPNETFLGISIGSAVSWLCPTDTHRPRNICNNRPHLCSTLCMRCGLIILFYVVVRTSLRKTAGQGTEEMRVRCVSIKCIVVRVLTEHRSVSSIHSHRSLLTHHFTLLTRADTDSVVYNRPCLSIVR